MTHMFFLAPIVMRISTIKTITNKSKYCLKTLLIKFMKVVGALVTPNDITINS